MNPLTEWQNFYMIVGSSAGALTGLQFVVIVECPVIFGPVHMRETLSQGAGHGTKEEAHS
jgi:hypothetical protein